MHSTYTAVRGGVIYKWFGICEFFTCPFQISFKNIGLLYHDIHKRINIMKGDIKKTANQRSFFSTVMSYFMLLTSIMNIYNIYIYIFISYICIYIYIYICVCVCV